MSVCLFVSFARADASAGRERLAQARVGERCLAHVPAQARDPFLDDGAPPALVVQAYFADLAALEAALPGLENMLGPGAVCEAMTVRRFAVARPGKGGCSYLVAYAGPADDPSAWHAHYNEQHAPLMASLPGIRGLEVYAPVSFSFGAVGWKPVRSLQRNKVAFDTPQALQAALASPVRAKMRADFARFPPYRGPVTHYPMLSFEPWQKT
jgi:uncharacterized protein (TIGR02118 family)